MTINRDTIPGNWAVSRIDRVASVKARIGWKALTAAEYQPDGYAFLSTPNIKSTVIDFENVNYISKFRYDESPELKLELGDVLLAKDGNTLGTCNFVSSLPRPATVNGSIAVIRPFAVEPRFLRYVLTSRQIQEHIDAVKDGMGVPHLFQRDIRRIELPLPPITEQRRIADFLDVEIARIDELIEASNRQESLLRERLLAWIRELTTGSTATETKRTGIAWMPRVASSWLLYRVGYTFKTGSGTTPRTSNEEYFGEGTPWLNTGDLNDGTVTAIGKSVTNKALKDYSPLRIYRAGSLVVAMYGATTGKLGILDRDACTNQACCVLFEPRQIDTLFAFYWFFAHRSNIVTLASGGGQPNISQDLIRSLRIPGPSLSEQRSIVSTIRSAEADSKEQRRLLTTRGSLLIERRQALISAAITGQLDVTTARGADLS